ncbi:transporter substrate-binding domain-containing protein [Salinispira pacifica]|uniref:histidine kinase n=1 Tax=Salinispira pacifica TaxID=1307761 RepID=V5WK93_9SPIO|nr:transporter substrate-binding domain-containing protein [Salinispira pacifica]AHC15601.1 Sensory box histidine kinase [Salinispira pacifica]
MTGQRKNTTLTLLLAAILLSFLQLEPIHAQEAERRTGETTTPVVIYGIMPDAHPTTFLDENEQPSGFFVELFSRILREEGYRINFVVDDFQSLYAMLVRGEIDLFTSLSRSMERERLFYFSQTPSTVAWAELFISQDNQFGGIADLRNKNIALVGGVSQSDAFRRAMEDFEIQFNEVPVSSFAEAAQLVTDSRAYGMVAYNWFVLDDPRVKPSGFSFQPTAGYPAFSKTDRNRQLADLVSQRLIELKNDPDSYYYRLYNTWILSTTETLPPWFSALIFASAFLVFILISFLMLLRREVAKRTAELAGLNQELEQRVEQRSRQLLEISQKARREETVQTLSSMIAGLTHRINSPLGNAITTASVIHDQLEDIPAEENAAEIQRIRSMKLHLKEASSLLTGNLHTVQQLIEHFKDIAVPLTGNLEQEVECRDFFFSLKEYTDTILGEGEWEQIWNIPDGKIRINPSLTLYIFEHLFSNIRDHAYPDKTGGKVEVNVDYGTVSDEQRGSEGPNGIAYSITVRDFGKGMTADVKERIYEPFFSAASSGTFNGIGLTSVYNRVHDGLGGEISCSSAPGEGSCFTIQVPVRNTHTE